MTYENVLKPEQRVIGKNLDEIQNLIKDFYSGEENVFVHRETNKHDGSVVFSIIKNREDTGYWWAKVE